MRLPRLLVVTDRTQAAGPLADVVADAVAAGARAVVLRDRDLPDLERAALATDLRALLDPVGGLLVTAEASSTASQPSSMASAASEAVPMPASSTTGTSTPSRSSTMLCGLRMPSPLPIGEPSGMTAAHPASASRRPRMGSSVV